jgi:hypothetical protein
MSAIAGLAASIGFLAAAVTVPPASLLSQRVGIVAQPAASGKTPIENIYDN